MRRIYWCAIGAGLAIAFPLTALAQEGEEPPVDEASAGEAEEQPAEEAAPAEEAPAAEPAGEAPAAKPGEGAPAGEVGGTKVEMGNAPTEYQVQEGDTLWDLSKKFLNNPWYWPKIWSYNPEIENPNWIYPGSKVRFYPGAGALPGEVEPAQPVEEPEEIEAPSEVPSQQLFEAQGVSEQLAARLKGEFTLAPGRKFVTREEMKDSGVIAGSLEEVRMLSLKQRVYVKLNSSAQPGQQFEIFKVVREIRHPITGSNLGYMTEILGTASVDRLDAKMATAVIETAYNEINRGDHLGPVTSRPNNVESKPNTKKLKGYVVDTEFANMVMYGESYLVFIDLGSRDGVEIGNTFIVVRAGDGYTRQTADFPDEDIGRLTVVDARDEVSTALVTFSTRELFPGDRIEMRVSQ